MLKYRLLVGLLVTALSSVALGDGVQGLNSDASVRSTVADVTDRGVESRVFEFYASDKAAQLEYVRDSSLLNVENGQISLSFLFDEQRDLVLTGGLVVDSTPVFLPGVTFSFGGKVYAALLGSENFDIFGLGLGLEAAYELPVKQFPLQLDAAFYYAPDILSFGQSDRIFDWQVNAGMRLRETVVAFVGYRYVQFDTRPGNQTPDNSVHVGIRWNMIK